MTQIEIWMQHAFKEAEKAYRKEEIPIGAVIVFENRIIGKGHNQVESLKDPTAHAEIIAITSAANYLSSKALLGCSMYVTLEPCSMCAGAIVLSKLENLFFGSFDSKSGACGSVLNITNNSSLNHKLNVSGGILDNKCSELLRNFFEVKR
ncbi:MAG: tRNA adenosine(34) deaminase TadA [Chlorobi bacterium]|nr:tRNA adenosine(34) deaminase TadA [Chlorobiota bacterium]MCI0715589.1 tRNA adenosine(34) deaminase TadA [Chlorobiota bacterium]